MASSGRRRKEDEVSKETILKVAMRRFLENGYSSTTVRDIANDVGVVQSAIIARFGSKVGILAEGVSDMINMEFRIAEELINGLTDDILLLFAVERVFQLYMAEMNENVRELYHVYYSTPEVSAILYDIVTTRLMHIFAGHLPKLKKKDFYVLELASSGVIQNFMKVPCSEEMTMEMKVKACLDATARIYEIPKKKQEEAFLLIKRIDFARAAEETIRRIGRSLE